MQKELKIKKSDQQISETKWEIPAAAEWKLKIFWTDTGKDTSQSRE